ncbi:SDR family NAD(P)-dependent oxidoreductase [Chitinophaga vietnamensis]|uniref:SDR family NAD(P)-dependent oxidoreductase n=1 Tax=Chitinophaga vietnamensis TaxID=2593957 RepID=UPI0011775A67|nr:SDR family oxidoreductase [Chitinophaga vietnamensis]
MAKKIALITGGSRGLGRNAALALSKKGFDVIITYHSKKDEAEKVVNEISNAGNQAAALQLNTASIAGFSDFAQRLGALLQEQWQRNTFDFLINNAGTNVKGAFGTFTEAQFDELLNIHFKGVFFLTQTLLPLLADKGGIINLSSGLARFALPGYAAYGAMKGAIEVLSRYMAKELGARGIRVNVIAPGAIDTDFNKSDFDAHPGSREAIGANTALGRIGVADDIGGVIASLCTDEMAWVNAQRIEASGGMFL